MLLSVVAASVLVTCEAVPPPAQACCRVMKQPAASPAQPGPTLSLTARRGMPAASRKTSPEAAVAGAGAGADTASRHHM